MRMRCEKSFDHHPSKMMDMLSTAVASCKVLSVTNICAGSCLALRDTWDTLKALTVCSQRMIAIGRCSSNGLQSKIKSWIFLVIFWYFLETHH